MTNFCAFLIFFCSDVEIQCCCVITSMQKLTREIEKHFKGEEGYSLVSVLMISQLLIILTVGFLMVAFFTNVLNAKFANKRKLDLLCRSAIELDKLHTLVYPYEKYIMEIDSTDILIEKRLKGLFIETTASCKNSLDSSKVKAVWGNSYVPQFTRALTLSESSARLATAGETYISGDIAFDGAGTLSYYKLVMVLKFLRVRFRE